MVTWRRRLRLSKGTESNRDLAASSGNQINVSSQELQQIIISGRLPTHLLDPALSRVNKKEECSLLLSLQQSVSRTIACEPEPFKAAAASRPGGT